MLVRTGPVVASILAVALVTAVIAVLDNWVPVLSLAVLYLFAVLPVAVAWGLPYAVVVSVASMLAFNWFFLKPVHTLSLADSRNWLALLVFLVTSVVVSELATRSRRRAREAALLAEIATTLLEHGTVSSELDEISAEAARALNAEHAEIALGESATGGFELTAAGRRIGTIRVEGGDAGARRRVLPALASLLAVVLDRERLAAEALEAEALRRADAIKTAVLRSVSHDLRTPLMAISTSAGALARPDLAIDDEDRTELLATILAASDRLDRLVANLLDLSRLQAGAAEPDRHLVSVDELVAGALDELGPDGRAVDVTLPDDPSSVLVDAHQVQRALVNLVENALKYSAPEDPVRVQVTGTQTEAAIRVIDHGPGVEPAERDRIFEPFQRGERSEQAGSRPRARDRPRLHRGERGQPLGRVARRPGRDVRAQVPGRRADSAGRNERMSPGPRVLVVDDEQQILRALRTSLRGAGYEVETADTAEGALAAAALRPPEAVILDLILPDGTGIDVARELRSWSTAPVIVLSAVGEEREKIAALDAGADDYVTKPVGIDELLARLRAVLRRAGPPSGPGHRDRRPGRRPREARGHDGRRAGASDAARVRAPPRPRLERGEAPHPPDAAPGGLGARVRQRVEPAPRERQPAPPEDRARQGASALPPDRARRGLPARQARLSNFRISSGERPRSSGGLQRPFLP